MKEYQSTKLRKNVLSELYKIAGEIQAKEGRNVGLTEVVELLLKKWREEKQK